MRIIIITFLFILFSHSYSFADNSKITPEYVERFVNERFENFRARISKEEYEKLKKTGEAHKSSKKFRNRRETIKKEIDFQKRIDARQIAKCAYGKNRSDECIAKVIRSVLTRSEKSKKKRPGDIFYVLDIIDRDNGPNVHTNWNLFVRYNSYTEGEKKPKKLPGIECKGGWYDYKGKEKFTCISYNKSFYKKFEKFKKNPAKENTIGLKRVKYLKRLKSIKKIREKLGIPLWEYERGSSKHDFARIAYPLIGDMLNAVVTDVIKTNVDPNLSKRRTLLKKYSLNLSQIDKKLEADDFKSIDKEKLKLAKAFKALKELKTTGNAIVNKVDQAVSIISDINKEIEISILKSKNNDQEKLYVRSLVFFIDTLIDSILDEIPEKYFTVTKPLNSNLFHEIELKELENIVERMVKINSKTKYDKLAKSTDVITKSSEFLDINDVIKKLENIGIKNSSSKPYTQETAAKIATDHIIDNLDKGILKESKKILQSLEKNSMSDFSKEITKVASEISSDPSVKSSTSISAVDRKYGGQSLKKLIAAGIIKR